MHQIGAIILTFLLLMAFCPSIFANQANPLPEQNHTSAAYEAAYTDLKVHFIDVGQADCILVELPNHESMLIDGGSEATGKTVLSYLKANGIDTIDYLIATHPHEDHIGGLPLLIDSLDIKSIYMPKAMNTTRIFEKLLLVIQEKGLSINTAKSGVSILSTPDLHINIVAPVSDKYVNLNNHSAVIRLQYGNTSFLFAGDAESVSEKEIIADAKSDIRANVLKIGHHGSTSSTTAPFLKRVAPDYAVISVGKDNSYGHPAQSVLSSLKAANIEVYRTDEQGTIVFVSDGENIAITASVTPTATTTPTTSTAPAAPATTTTSSAYTKPEAVQQAPAQTQSTTVYVTKTGAKYHVGGCRYLSQSQISISLENARRSYGPCSVCKPPK